MNTETTVIVASIFSFLVITVIALAVTSNLYATKLAKSDKPLELACAYDGNDSRVVQSCLTLQMIKE